MKLIKTEFVVERTAPQRGWPFGQRQVLWKRYRLLGIRIWQKRLGSERIPHWAVIQMASLGFTDWKSSFADYIK